MRPAAVASAFCFSAAAYAQIGGGGGGIAIDGATILVGDGTRLEKGGVFLQGSRIGMVGEKLDPLPRARRIDATGKFITPGFIDVWSTLGVRSEPGPRSPLSSAADAFDRFGREDIDAVVQGGVTTAYIPARSAFGIGGSGAVVRLLPDAPLTDIVLKADAALDASLGIDERQSPLDRVKAAAELTKQFRDARQYRTSREDYEHDLKEYEEKVKKRADEQARNEKPADKDEKKDPSAAPDDDVAPHADDASRRFADDDPTQVPPRRPRRPDGPRGGAPGGSAPAAEARPGGAPAGKDDIKKPVEPARERQKDRLLEVIDGKLPLRIEAHRPEDLFNAIDLAREQNVALILAGASSSPLVARALVNERIPIILPAEAPAMRFEAGVLRYSQPRIAASLAEAGADVYFASGPAAGESGARHLRLALARAVGEGFPADRAIRAVTGDAARLLGVSADVGRVSAGLYADLVVWSGDPLSPTSIVERVFIRGREVYSIHKPAGEKPADPDDPGQAPASASAPAASSPRKEAE